MATTVWKGHLTFGLISIPMRMSAAARGERISFNQLHNVCHSRLKQPLFCPVCNRNVERSEIVKGHEYEKDQYVLFSEEELDKIEPTSAKVMEILEFVKLDDMDPLYFDSSYYVAPEDAGVKAYKLLLSAMQESGYGAIAKLTMHQREHIVILRPGSRGMTLHTMFYSNEIRAAESVPTDKVELKDQEKKLAHQLIESLAAPFAPEKYRDEYQENVKVMIAAKLKGQEVTGSGDRFDGSPQEESGGKESAGCGRPVRSSGVGRQEAPRTCCATDLCAEEGRKEGHRLISTWARRTDLAQQMSSALWA
jgi:DNA end-binding protein Ku